MLGLAADGADVVLATDAGLRTCIVLDDAADQLERLAAREIADHLEAITGQRPPIGAERMEGHASIQFGDLRDDRPQAPGAFALVVAGDRIYISGKEPIGTLYGAYELLEQLGVRWYMPGELGRVLPAKGRLAIREQSTLQVPSFQARAISGSTVSWRRRNRLGGVTPPSALRFPDPAPFAEQPELYALVDGQRVKDQLCVSNPATLRLMITTIRSYFAKRPAAQWVPVSNHGSNHCECADCRALDPAEPLSTAFTGGRNLNDRYVWFCNQILEALAAELPDKRLALTVCTPQFQPPAAVRGHANLDVLAWANGFCRLHGVNNPACPKRQHVLAMEARWVEVLAGSFYERTNWGNIAGPGLLFPAVHRFREDFPAYRAVGVKGVRGADYSHLISQVPGSYIGARLLWDHEADVDALLIEFYRRFYGPAAVPMQAYHELLEATVRDAPFHAGTAIALPRIYTPSVRQQARRHLEAARQQVTDSPYTDRLQAMTLALDYLDAFCRMIAARDAGQLTEAKAALDDCYALIERLQTDYDPPLLNRSFTPAYLRLFFGQAVTEAWEKTVRDGRLVVTFDPVWEFRLEGEPDTAWRPQATWTSSWSHEGLGDYDGVAWYRQRFKLPGRRQPLQLWFGGVDETITVWVNGKEVGTHTGAFRTVEFPITQAVVYGADNTLLIRVANQTLDEVGTGGLLAPVLIYSSGE